MSSIRAQKVSDFLRKEISLLISTEINDPRLKNINITDYTYNPNKIPKFGGGATFKKEDDRGKVKISIEIINMIKKDSEFLNLVKKYYNYDIISKLEKHIKYN